MNMPDDEMIAQLDYDRESEPMTSTECVCCKKETPTPIAISGDAFYACTHCGKDVFSGGDFLDWSHGRSEEWADHETEIITPAQPPSPHRHYFKRVTGLDFIDVYRLLELYEVTCPIAQHIVKKALAAGKRGAKNQSRDMQDIADSANRFLQMREEDEARC